MTRRISLALHESVTGASCGGCRFATQPAGGGGWGGPPYCTAFSEALKASYDVFHNILYTRLAACVEAERAEGGER